MYVFGMVTTYESNASAQRTKAGEAIAWRMNPAIGTTSAIVGTCSLIHRHAVTYSRIQEAWCNDAMGDAATARLEAREARLEARITALVESLPHADPIAPGSHHTKPGGNGGAWSVRFSGDPRGNTVGIIPPDGWAHLADNWDGERIGCDN